MIASIGEKSNIRSIDVTKRIFTLSGKYVMVTESQPFVVATTSYGRFLNSEISTDTPGQWDTSAAAKGAAVDAHFNVAEALRYFRSVHGRRSTTGLGNPISVVAHYQFARSDGTKYGENAANNSFAWVVNEVQCGDGNYLSGGNMLPPCSALDVAAHEIAHGVTNYTSGLVYERESGALNESFSDAMGAAAENELETKEPARNFVIGERIMKNGAGFRDMQNTRPGAIDHYNNLRPCAGKPDLANDWCGVHSNSGIPNRAFTLMTAGGVHGTATSRVGVAQGIGFVVARDLWYGTFTKLAPDANFQTAALAQVVEASRHGLDALRAVGCAWLAVGVIRLDAHPLLSAVTCPVPGAAPAAPKSPDCQGRDNGWFCSENVQNSAVHCVGGATVGGSFCANTEQKCKKAAVDDWTAAVTPEGLVTCQ